MFDAQEPPRVLALVGMPGSGKTLCAQHLKALGYYQFRFGGIVVGEVEQRGLAVTPENERTVREELRARHGMAAMARLALPHLHEALRQHSSVIIDGLYSFSEYKLLRQELGEPMIVVAIIAPRWLRYQRLAQRPERPLTPEEAEARDWQEVETLEKGGPIALADYTLLNDGRPEELLASLDALMAKFSFRP